ncbi:MAG: hypothetical protein K6E12_03580 [Saccharofermentans sp.]|nr:hypothetical protein [Saccharofermentans sp.]
MAIDISRDLNVRYELLSRSINEIEKKLELLPAGGINVKHLNRRDYYYHVTDGREKYLGPNDAQLIGSIIQKDYLKRVLKEAKRELKAIERMLKIYPETLVEDVFDLLPEGRKAHAKPINICDDAFAAKWMETPYRRKAFGRDAPEFYTIKGERVRSKSEVIIADRLMANGIPYRYECPLKLGKKIIHPDFTILRMSDRKILYHEHCGKIGDPQYAEDMLVRARDYNRAGILFGDRLFYTFESETVPLDVKNLDDIIRQHYR